MKNHSRLGIALSIIGFLVGILLAYQIASIYQSTINGKIAQGRPDEGITVQIVFAILGWLSLTGAALMVVGLYGYIKKHEWAWFLIIIPATIYMLTSFFPIIPPASVGLPSPTLPTFFLATILWFGILVISRIEKKIIAISFVAGLAYVLTFMDGVATISRYQTVSEAFPHGMFAVTQMVNWWGAAAWAVFIFALLKRRSWVLPLGIFAAMMSILGGYPLGLREVLLGEGFSMFLPAPLLGTLLLIGLLLPPVQRIIDRWISY